MHVSQVPEGRGILGYSLGGLFSLWAFYESGAFGRCASCSGSLWYDDWLAYARARTPIVGSRVYLSLGSGEEKTRNRRMAAVGDATRAMEELLKAQPNVAECELVLHEGGHFHDTANRISQAIVWLMKR